MSQPTNPPGDTGRTGSVSPTPPPKTDPALAEHPATLDLDVLERENAPAPFTFVHQGRRFMMSDPQEVDWQELMVAISNPHMFFRHVLPPEYHEPFFATHMPSWKMSALMERYSQHYGLPDPKAAGA